MMLYQDRDKRMDEFASNSSSIFIMLKNALQNLQYGEVILNVHNGSIVQITRVEKTRFEKTSQIKKNDNLR